MVLLLNLLSHKKTDFLIALSCKNYNMLIANRKLILKLFLFFVCEHKLSFMVNQLLITRFPDCLEMYVDGFLRKVW